MKYYKVKQGNSIIDVLADPQFVIFQEGNRKVILGKESEAFGVLSSDSAVIYEVEGMKPAPIGDEFNYKVVQLELIGADEYEQLRVELDSGSEVQEPDNEQQEQETEATMGIPEMRLEIIALKEANAKLEEQNTFLQDCLMEMADVVYK